MKHLLISFFITIIFAEIPSKDYNDWIVLQNNDIWIGYTETDYPWCKTKMIFNNSVDEILAIVEDVNNYYIFFDSIVYSTLDENDIVHVMVDYPIPFSDRDYVVKFKLIFEEGDIVYRFESKDKSKPHHRDYVRLANAAGEWRLSPIDENYVEVSYVWNGELKGNFPSWTLTRAWMRQGNEIMNSLKSELSKGEINEGL